MIVTVENLQKTYSEKPLLQNMQLYVNEGEKIGVIGQNGCGKSTLLKILAGEEQPDDGSVIFGNHVVISYLPQNPGFAAEKGVLETVLEYCASKGEVWDLEGQAKSMLNRLGLTDWNQNCGVLSGGQKKRLALVMALLVPSDLLILDEPTNHLDAEMIEWLEQFLKSRRGALLMVTHDRYFLDSVTNRIIEIFRGEAFVYECNYSGFLEKKVERLQMEQAQEQKRQNLLRNELAWVRRGARARTTKQKARLERFAELNAQQAPEQETQLEMHAASTRMGRTTVELHDICKSYDDHVLVRDFTYVFGRRDRVGFVGGNGTGKTTLMRMIYGAVQPDRGRIEIGQTITMGYYSQMLTDQASDAIDYMNPRQRVIDYIRDTAEYVRTEEGLVSASKMLERFLFQGDKQYTLIEKLSGGEKRRLNLLRVLMQAPNVLILDEPTNDLDLTTLTVLEDYLDHFDGIVITVSHDRYFLDRIVSRIFAFEENGTLRQYEGGYTDYYLKKQAAAEAAEETKGRTKTAPVSGKTAWKERPRERKLKFTWQEAKDYEVIEEQIAEIEDALANVEDQMGKAGSDYIRLNTLQAEKDGLEQRLEEKMERWAYLEELAEKIQNQNG